MDAPDSLKSQNPRTNNRKWMEGFALCSTEATQKVFAPTAAGLVRYDSYISEHRRRSIRILLELNHIAART